MSFCTLIKTDSMQIPCCEQFYVLTAFSFVNHLWKYLREQTRDKTLLKILGKKVKFDLSV